MHRENKYTSVRGGGQIRAYFRRDLNCQINGENRPIAERESYAEKMNVPRVAAVTIIISRRGAVLLPQRFRETREIAIE